MASPPLPGWGFYDLKEGTYVMNELFELFQNKKTDFELYEKVLLLINKKIHQARGAECAKFYDVLTELSTSINNAGWEKRHSEQLDIINKESRRIYDKYEEFMS